MGKVTSLVGAVGRMAGSVPEPIRSAVRDEVRKTVEQVAPSPEQIARGVTAAGERLRERAPEAMGKAQAAAGGVLSAARRYAPGVLDRAERIADDIRSGKASQRGASAAQGGASGADACGSAGSAGHDGGEG